MKTGVLLTAAVALAFAWSSPGFATQPAKSHKASTHAQPAPRVAPLDEYFGKMKLSPLGINNTIHDTNLRISYDTPHAARYYQTLAWAEDALHDWARKYPHDTWLPGRAYFMSHVFWRMHAPEADAAAGRCRLMLFKQFPKSHWAALAKHETKEKIAPLQAGGSSASAAQAQH